MKTIYIIVLFFCTLSLSAQNFYAAQNEVIVESVDAGLMGNTHIHKTSTTSLLVEWERINVDLPDGWTVSTCFPMCFPADQFEGNTSLTEDSTYLNGHFYVNDIIGTGSYTIRVFHKSLSDEVFVTWYGSNQVNSTGDIEFVQYTVFPNPTEDEVSIMADNQNFESYTLVDLSGRIVETAAVDTDQTQIQMLDLPAGIYMLNLITINGDTFREKIIKK